MKLSLRRPPFAPRPIGFYHEILKGALLSCVKRRSTQRVSTRQQQDDALTSSFFKNLPAVLVISGFTLFSVWFWLSPQI